MKMKHFCINCFEDENIKKFIKNNGKLVKDENFECEFCQAGKWEHKAKYDIKEYSKKLYKSEERYIIKQDVLNKKIIKIINEHFDYVKSPKASDKNLLLNLVDILSDKLFHDSTDLLHRLATHNFISYEDFPLSTCCTEEREIHWIDCWKQKENISWKQFKEHTKYKARYFDHEKSDFKLSQKLKPFEKIYKSLKKTLKTQKVYRARLVNSQKEKEDIAKLPEVELGKAPKEMAKNNRFSPIGISYGYYSFDMQTAIHEIRAEHDEEVAIGVFELRDTLSLIDLRKEYCLSSEQYEKNINPFDQENFNILIIDIYEFIADISKPINKRDITLEYVPTQIMAEYIWSLEYDGFIFDSSQIRGGKNLVLFGDNPKYIEHKFIKIKEKNIYYNYEESNEEIKSTI